MGERAHGAKASAGGRLRGEAGTAIMAKAGLHRAAAEISRLDEDVVAMLDGKLTRKRAARALDRKGGKGGFQGNPIHPHEGPRGNLPLGPPGSPVGPDVEVMT